MFGLQAAFFASGVKRLIGTLWPMEDKPEVIAIVNRFHESYATGVRPEEALQSAIKSYLSDHPAGGFSNIYFWGPFILVAVGRPTTDF